MHEIGGGWVIRGEGGCVVTTAWMGDGGRGGACAGAYKHAMDALAERLHGIDETGLTAEKRGRERRGS